MRLFKDLAIPDSNQLIFGKSPNPVRCGKDLEIGGGLVYPEINFTLPQMLIEEKTWNEVLKHYEEIAHDILQRTKELKIPGLVVEFEELPPMTMKPEWGAEITALLQKRLHQFNKETGIPTALRVTVVDVRDAERPPLLRDGKLWETTREAFVLAAQAGADILSIESVGGKEVHDQALVYGDLAGICGSLGSLAWRDVGWLWDEITAIAEEYNIIPGGDTACGFSNTAMQLAGKGMLPTVLAAIDRAASAPRSLAAYEHGAVGPSKDCAYEGPILKAITGYPISMEGKSACCAHFSPLGNIAGAVTDLWSNESVQNIRLLSGNAPAAFLELLAYDCRLFNTSSLNNPLQYRKLLVESDISLSVEALMLEPNVVIKIASAIVAHEGGYLQTLAAVKTAYQEICSAIADKTVTISEKEQVWLNNLEKQIEALPQGDDAAIEYLKSNYGTFFRPESYRLD